MLQPFFLLSSQWTPSATRTQLKNLFSARLHHFLLCAPNPTHHPVIFFVLFNSSLSVTFVYCHKNDCRDTCPCTWICVSAFLCVLIFLGCLCLSWGSSVALHSPGGPVCFWHSSQLGLGRMGVLRLFFWSSSYGCFRLLKASQQICSGPIVILMASVNKGSGFIPVTPPCPQYEEAAESFLEGPVHSFQEVGGREGSLQIWHKPVGWFWFELMVSGTLFWWNF